MFQSVCGKTVDKYSEYDGVLIFLDALLHKPQAFRHVLFNLHLKVSNTSYFELLTILNVAIPT